MRVDQIGLLLWKNYVVRKRQPGMLALVFLWPVFVFMILYTVRDNIDPEYNPTCQFPARSMPHDGLLPFVQSFICTIGNPCNPLSEYEEVPSYKNASMGSLIVELQPMLSNNTILSAIKSMPHSIQLLKSMAEILTKPEIKALFDRGIRLGDLFNNHEEIKSWLKTQLPEAREGLIDGLFQGSIKLLYLIETFGSSDIGGVVCSPESLKKYLILSNDEDYEEISKFLCQIDSNQIPDILENLSKHLDFSGLLSMVDRVMAKFREYDFFDDLRRAVITILNLETTKKYVPTYLRLQEWLPKIIMLFKNTTFKEIDLNFLNKSVEILDPIFQPQRNWPIARNGFKNINKMLKLIKDVWKNEVIDEPVDFLDMMNQLLSKFQSFSANPEMDKNITQILDMAYLVLQDGIRLTNKLLIQHQDQIEVTAAVMDSLKTFFSDKIVNTLTYFVSIVENVIRMTHHVAVLHEEILPRVYDVATKHKELVQKLLSNFSPVIYRSVIRAFSNLDFVERVVSSIKKTKPADTLCQNGRLVEIFGALQTLERETDKLNNLLCDDSGKEFINDIYDTMNFRGFYENVDNTLSSLVMAALSQPVSTTRSNLTTVVKTIKAFASYLESPKIADPDWSNTFNISDEWSNTFNETKFQGRLDILGIHLSIAKLSGSRSLSFSIILPDLKNMDMIADRIIHDIQTYPSDWINEIRHYEFDLIQSFYLTTSDRQKILKILEYSNFTKAYCVEENSPALLNFPRGSNETLLKEFICRMARSVQTALTLNVTNIENEEEHLTEFNWTNFNEKIIEIYQYVDSLVHYDDQNFIPSKLQDLKNKFKQSWIKDVTVRDAWEIGIGLICKVFNIMESPLFKIQAKERWKHFYAVAWASSIVLDNFERIIDQIQKNNHTAKLSEILHDLPQTEILIEVILRNISPVVLDFVDLISMKLPINLMTTVSQYKINEPEWPCVKNQSIGSYLKLRNGSREVLREMERIACNPGSFIKEWNDQPVLMRVRKIFQDNDTIEFPPFNWTSGYTKFRRIAEKFDHFINDTRDVVLLEMPKLKEYINNIDDEIDNLVAERIPQVKSRVKSIFDYIDSNLDKSINIFRSNLTAEDVFHPDVDRIDRLLVLTKFISHVVHGASTIVSNIITNDNDAINFLLLSGFTNNTAISIFYNQFPDILSTIINGLSDPNLISKFDRNKQIFCSNVFDWWLEYRINLSIEDYTILANFTCNIDPENFNAYTTFFINEGIVWRSPVKEYPSLVGASIGDVIDMTKHIRKLLVKNISIEAPFSKKYFNDVSLKMKDMLERQINGKFLTEHLKPNSDWIGYKLVIEGISEILSHVAEILEHAQVHNNELHIWELVKTGGVEQFLKLVESHPEESISLIATLSTVDLSTGRALLFNEPRKTICDPIIRSTAEKDNKTRFLSEICSFDPRQLLTTATSENFTVVSFDRKPHTLTFMPLTVSVNKLIGAVLNLTNANPNIVLRSNIFNATTWRGLSQETLSLIRKAEESWIRDILVTYFSLSNPEKIPPKYNFFVVEAIRMFEILDSLTVILSGGDVWQKLRNIYENSKVKPVISIIEDTPNIIVSIIETFVNSEKLNDFVKKLLNGEAHPCDIDKYLITPNFMRKKGLMSAITNFCQKIVLNNKSLTAMDFMPFETRIEEHQDPQMSHIIIDRENQTAVDLLEKVYRYQSTLVRVFSEGFRSPKVPIWWTSFEEGTYKDFIAQYKKKDTRNLAHTVVKKIMSFLNDFLENVDTKNCSWCHTLLIEIVNSQLSQHKAYADVICKMNHMNISELHDIFMRDFNWNETAALMKNFENVNIKKTIPEFLAKLNDTMYYIADIIVDYHNDTFNEQITTCFRKFVGTPGHLRPGLLIMFANTMLGVLQRNINILDTAHTHKQLSNLTSLTDESVPIWKPLREVVDKSFTDEVDKFLPSATINVNAILNDRKYSLCRTKEECKDPKILYDFLNTKKAGKVLRYDAKLANYPLIADISEKLAKHLNLERINYEMKTWRRDAAWDLTWLTELLRHISIILEESGNLLDVASKIDFEDVSNLLNVPDLADGVVSLLKDKTVDKLFDGMKELLDDVEPFVKDKEVIEDLHSIVAALENMEIFKNLGLLDMRYLISDMFDNWDSVRLYLSNKIGLSPQIAATLSQARIDMISVFLRERRAISLKSTICSPEKLGEMLSFEHTQVTVEEVSSVLCQLDDAKTQNVSITLIKNLNFDYIFRNLMSANVKNILANANLTEAEGKVVLDNMGVASELLPYFKNKFSSGFTVPSSTEEETDEPISNSKFLSDSSELLCGQPLISDSGRFYKYIASIEDNSKEYDKKELDSLPTNFCKDTYKGVIGMPGGKIVWSYVKPLLRGHILYTPDTVSIDKVMAVANETFVQMANFGDLMNSFENTLISLANLSEMGDNLRDLQNVMSSDVMKIAIKSLGGGNFEGADFSDLNLSEIAWKLKKSKKLIKMVGMLNDLLECVLVDRIKGFATEQLLEAEASALTDTNEFLAGVVFLDDSSERIRRSTNNKLPDNISYKIRMDVDYVPSTRRLKNQFWLPGPESSFLEDLRYLRGFIQLQDAVDHGIIQVKSEKAYNWRTMTQQMPYPCWKFVPFQSTLYESQGLQMCFFFALMMCVGSAVRHIVWERESRNAMVMSVMGLKTWQNNLAWFITSYIELVIVMISIALILLVGQILPNSNPLLVLLLLANYIFSVVTFCYMISTIFNSASLAAVTAVVMFLLTYMPYIIVIAMEAAMGIGYKLIICLSMSTSFCYGCLFAARKEVQGVGLTWESMWEESSPGDSMSLGLVFIMITLDGCIYAIIGYLVTRYTNSGKGFHALRSSSLWWNDTRALYGRPGYLAFENNLYFTNDVLHPSATYQDDESDTSNLVVSEKQIGVRFEEIRKVYDTNRGTIVAVENFSLKLCEGEVTSLLGRNGAGKTTIIKMLTGMLEPTSGEIWINGEEDCKPDIGVCPQENVLISCLTPREHLMFYSKLKRSMDNISMQKNVNEMLASLELGRQEHEPVSRLSGGTKRRLCVALAFLGSPKLVILDEPGAGVDPAARRRIWRLIDQHRVGRTVLLSTHHLDEADMLSDTVVVMHRGKILCSGSPQYLKMTYGQGYKLHACYSPTIGNIEKMNSESVLSVVREAVDNCVLNTISGSEITVTLPFKGKHGLNNDIEKALMLVEGKKECLGFTHLSLECDSLEKVFLDLCSQAENGSASIKASMDSIITVDQPIGLSIPEDDIDLVRPDIAPKRSPWRQAKALLKKRLWHFARDWRAPLSALILPTMFVAVAMGFSLIRPPSENEPPLNLNPKLYNIHPTHFYSINNSDDPFLQHISLQLHDRFGDDYAGAWQTLPNDTGTCECRDGQQKCQGVSKSIEGLLQTLPGRPTLDWIVSTHLEYIEKRYGGWSLSHHNEDPLFSVWYNNKGHHSLPAYLNALNDAILRATGVNGHITTFNHPIKLSSDQLNRTSLLQHVADVGVALVLLIAFSLVGAQGTKELVRERLSEEKRILYLAGVHPTVYWTTAMIWDLIVYGCAVLLAVIVFEIFGLPAYVERDNLAGTCLLLMLFAWAAIPFSQLVEKVFDDSSLSNMVLFCTNTFIGVASLATILVIDILGKTEAAEELRKVLHRVLMILPQYALGDALIQLSRNDITAELLERFHMDTYQSPLGWDLLGLHYVALATVGAILFLLNLTIECRLVPDYRIKRPIYETIEEDDDVVKERTRIEGGHGDDVLKTINLRKEYSSVYGTNVAVQNLSFGVLPGKCFGLLGVNGAGKSTTFKMLTTEIIPTAGKIVLSKSEIGSGPLCNGEVGYCPQSEALDGFLTPHQCLTVHGEVSGLRDVPKIVESLLKKFDLLKYAHQRVDSLSGGNKRKLCTAVSVMSPTSVVLMDEPTSGMDPATKALVAQAIRAVNKNNTSVILTSHSVADCENLCSRVGILAKAGLRCIGTPQHLKHKFGEGYIAFLRFGLPVTSSDLKKAISEFLPHSAISSKQATAARILIPRSEEIVLSAIFARVRQLADRLNAIDYTLTQSSLDQVLVSFSEELEDEPTACDSIGNGNGRMAYRNMYASMDTIHLETF